MYERPWSSVDPRHRSRAYTGAFGLASNQLQKYWMMARVRIARLCSRARSSLGGCSGDGILANDLVLERRGDDWQQLRLGIELECIVDVALEVDCQGRNTQQRPDEEEEEDRGRPSFNKHSR